MEHRPTVYKGPNHEDSDTYTPVIILNFIYFYRRRLVFFIYLSAFIRRTSQLIAVVRTRVYAFAE